MKNCESRQHYLLTNRSTTFKRILKHVDIYFKNIGGIFLKGISERNDFKRISSGVGKRHRRRKMQTRGETTAAVITFREHQAHAEARCPQ